MDIRDPHYQMLVEKIEKLEADVARLRWDMTTMHLNRVTDLCDAYLARHRGGTDVPAPPRAVEYRCGTCTHKALPKSQGRCGACYHDDRLPNWAPASTPASTRRVSPERIAAIRKALAFRLEREPNMTTTDADIRDMCDDLEDFAKALGLDNQVPD